MSIEFAYDDLFIWAPSMLTEGKAVGTAKTGDLELAQLLTKNPDADLAAFANARKKGQTVGKRKLKEVQVRVKTHMLDLITDYQAHTLPEDMFRKAAVKEMKTAWRDVFLAGVRAGGVAGAGSGPGKTMVNLSSGDDKWLKGAMTHEMKFLNGFLKAIMEDDYKMPLERRTQMYVNALTSFYESARVIALPANVVVRWTGPGDKRTCIGCDYMFENNPYTKKTLPTTPRAGMTPCLTNCRDRLLIRRVEPTEALAVQESSLKVGTHIKHLRKLKRVGHL